MADVDPDRRDRGLAGMARRERLERIAAAERDRRDGRPAMAAAAVGEPNEWPARVVLALTRLVSEDVDGARRLLEEGLDRWAVDLGLAPLESPSAPSPVDEGGVGAEELDRAFAEAEADVEQMVDVNRVAARVLMEEPIDWAEPSPEPGALGEPAERGASDGPGDAADPGEPSEAFAIRAASPAEEVPASRSHVLATLERWLHNLEQRPPRRGRTRESTSPFP